MRTDRSGRPSLLREIFELLDGTVGAYTRDQGSMYAGAVAFYAILSLIPLVVLLASVLGFALNIWSHDDPNRVITELMAEVHKVIPYIDQSLQDDVRAIVVNRGKLGLMGFIALMWSSSQGFRALELAYARIFAGVSAEQSARHEASPRGLLKSKLFFSALISAAVASFLGFRLFLGIVRELAYVLPPPLQDLVKNPFGLGDITGDLLTATSIALGFVVVLRASTDEQLRTRYLLVGGGVFYAGWQIGQVVYGVYLARFTNMGAMYGSLATLMIIVLWLYYCATLLLVCGYVVKTLQRRANRARRFSPDPVLDKTRAPVVSSG